LKFNECQTSINVCETSSPQNPCPTPGPRTPIDIPPDVSPCDSIVENEAHQKCERCKNDHNGIWTAVGCISFTPVKFTEDILKLVTGIAGGIALLLMLFGAAQMSMSAGDPKAMDAGKNTFTSALIGLLIIIFSVVILNIIGVTIIRIPGF
jgi:hypothetical protein